MPLSAAVFESERKNVVPLCPPRIVVQHMAKVTWTRMPNRLPAPECKRAVERSKGWTTELRWNEQNPESRTFNFAAAPKPQFNRIFLVVYCTTMILKQ